MTGRDEAPVLIYIARTEGLTLLLMVDGGFDVQYSDGNPSEHVCSISRQFPVGGGTLKLELRYFLARSHLVAFYKLGTEKTGRLPDSG